MLPPITPIEGEPPAPLLFSWLGCGIRRDAGEPGLIVRVGSISRPTGTIRRYFAAPLVVTVTVPFVPGGTSGAAHISSHNITLPRPV